jgi:hypothetical protein
MKAKMSVTDVTVMDTPPCFSIKPILSGTGSFFCSLDKSSQHAIITNISSIPAQCSINGSIKRTECYLSPLKEKVMKCEWVRKRRQTGNIIRIQL